MSKQLLKFHYPIILPVSIVIVLLSCSAPKKYTVNNHMMIQEQGCFAVGGTVITNPGVFDPYKPTRAGQTLLAISGTCYYQEKGQPKRILRKGDVVKCPPNIEHWHGASPHDEFVQVAITNTQQGQTVWLIPVTDKEYNATPGR